ncbi:MAG: hypothetical protein P0Y66_02025 [Candidatus Kaistia colombiensis]|nr:MAG: hypothetical protein P0Y66_02025 [Kaistia sp.]
MASTLDNRHKSKRLVVEKLSDEELLKAILHTTDPSTMPGRVETPPAEDAELIFEMTYDAPEVVDCVWGHKHKRGLVLKDANGNRYLIGHDCGQNKFGLDWQYMESQREAQKKRQDYLLSLRSFAALLTSEMPWLQSLPQHPAVQAHDELRKAIRNKSPKFFEDLIKVQAGEAARLSKVVAERDFKAEEARRERADQDPSNYRKMSKQSQAEHRQDYAKRKDPIYRNVRRDLGPMLGLSLISRLGPLSGRLASHVSRLPGIASTALTLPAAIDLKAQTRITRTLVQETQTLLEEVDDAASFFSPEHCQAISEWSASRDAGYSIEPIARGLRIRGETAGSSTDLVKPLELQKPDLTRLLSLLARLAGKT